MIISRQADRHGPYTKRRVLWNSPPIKVSLFLRSELESWRHVGRADQHSMSCRTQLTQLHLDRPLASRSSWPSENDLAAKDKKLATIIQYVTCGYVWTYIIDQWGIPSYGPCKSVYFKKVRVLRFKSLATLCFKIATSCCNYVFNPFHCLEFGKAMLEAHTFAAKQNSLNAWDIEVSRSWKWPSTIFHTILAVSPKLFFPSQTCLSISSSWSYFMVSGDTAYITTIPNISCSHDEELQVLHGFVDRFPSDLAILLIKDTIHAQSSILLYWK